MSVDQEHFPAAPEADLDDGSDWLLRAKQVGVVATLSGVAFIGGFIAGDMAPTDVELGPHDATVQLTVDPRATLDLGPIGSISTQSPLKVGDFEVGGIKVTVKEIPDGDGSTLGAGEVRQYEQFFTAPGRHTLQESVEDALIERGLQSGGIAAGAVLMGYWLLQPRGRAALAEVVKSRRMGLTAGVAASALLLSSGVPSAHSHELTENAVLASVGVHGVTVEGKVLETLVNKYGPQAINYVRDLDTYYKDMNKTLQAALKEKQLKEKEHPTELSRMLEQDEAESVLWISDNHCNTETAAIAADVAKSTDAVMILDSGDQTMGGTEAERLCVAILPQRISKDVPIVVALGNHDARDITARMDKELGYTVLEGKPSKVKGYTIVGDSDVMRSEFNVPYRQIGSESVAEEGQRIAKVACDAVGVDIVLTHEPEAATASAEEACAPFVGSGHTHSFKGPMTHVSESGAVSYQMVNGTTGGAAPDKMTFESKLGKDATMVQLVFDKKTKLPLGYRTIVMHPDKTVTIGDLTAYQAPLLPGKKVEPNPTPSATKN